MNLSSRLTSLEARGLLRSLGDPGDPEFIFRHTLFQETAYGSLLRGERMALHRSVAHVLETASPSDRESLAPILGYHFLQAGDEVKALDYLTIAAEAAAKVSANQEALEHYRKAIELARRVRPEEACLLRLYAGCGRMHELMGDLDGAVETYTGMEEVARSLGFSKMALQSRVARDTLRSSPSSVRAGSAGESSTRETLRLAREAGDREAEARSLWNLMLEGFFYGLEEESRRSGEQALEIAREIGNRELQAFISNDLSRNYLFYKGQSERGLELAGEARALWKEFDNRPMLADNLAGSAMFAAYVGDYPRALDFSEQALALSQEIDNPWGKSYSQYHLNFVYADLGDYPEAIRRGADALYWAGVAGFIVPEVITRGFQGWALAQVGRYDQGLEECRKGVEFGRQAIPALLPAPLSLQVLVCQDMGDHQSASAIIGELETILGDSEQRIFPLALAYGLLAPIVFHLAEGDFETADTWADKLNEFQTGANFNNFHPDVLLAKAVCADARSDRVAARTWLEQALEAGARIGSKRAQWQVLAQMSEWAARDGQRNQADELKTQARAILTEIADRMDPEMRAGYLSTPPVARLWSA